MNELLSILSVVLVGASGLGVIIYFAPGIEAIRFWMSAKRDELANRALLAKRERR